MPCCSASQPEALPFRRISGHAFTRGTPCHKRGAGIFPREQDRITCGSGMSLTPTGSFMQPLTDKVRQELDLAIPVYPVAPTCARRSS